MSIERGEKKGKLLASRTEEVYQSLESWYNALTLEIRDKAQEYERGISNSPVKSKGDVYHPFVPFPVIKEKYRKRTGKTDIRSGHYLVALAIYFADKSQDIEERFEHLAGELLVKHEEEYDRISTIYSIINDQNLNKKTAYLEPESGFLGFVLLPKQIFKSPEVKSAEKKPGSHFASYISHYSAVENNISPEEFKATLRHESTHLYIHSKAGHSDRLHKNTISLSQAIHEGAARVTHYLTTDQKETGIKGYRKKGVKPEDIQIAEKILHDEASDLLDDGGTEEEAISLVRSESARAYRNLVSQRNIDIISAFRQGNTEYQRLRSIFHHIEKADIKTWNIVGLYGLNVEKKNRQLKKGPQNSLHSNILERLKGAERDLLKSEIAQDEDSGSIFQSTNAKLSNPHGEVRFSKKSAMQKLLKTRRELVDLREQLLELEEKHKDSKLGREVSKERKNLENIVSDISEFLRTYNKEDKLASLISDELDELDREIDLSDLKKNYGDDLFLSSKRIKQAEKDLKPYLLEIVNSYITILSAAEKINKKLLSLLDKLNGELTETSKNVDEESETIKRQYSGQKGGVNQTIRAFEEDLEHEFEDLKKMLDITREIQEATKEAERHIQESKEYLENAKKEIGKL